MPGKDELKINKKFAQRYEKYRQKEELQKLKDRYGDSGDEPDTSESEEEEDSEVEIDPKVERDFYRTLSLLKQKDPRIYERDCTFYNDEELPSTSTKSSTKQKVEEQSMFLKDYERKVILEKGGKYEDEDESDDEERQKINERAASPSYIKEQKEIKDSFRKFIEDSEEEEDDVELLTRRIKSQEEKDKEEEDYLQWLKGQGEASADIQDMKYLRDYWNDPDLDDGEKFLRDYVLNKGYLDEENSDGEIPTYDEIVQEEVEDSEDEGELFLQKQADFERQYNFRFEEPDANVIKTYPRTIASSVRTKDVRRKLKREETKERKQKEKQHKQEELKQLKNLKRQEILAKLQKLKELTGNETVGFNEGDLEGDFDPQQHDKLMQKFFGSEFYGQDESYKPQFEEEDDLDGEWNWDNWTGNDEDYVEEETYEPYCEDPGFIMDADFDPSEHSSLSKKKKKKLKAEASLRKGKKRKSHFAEVLNKSKPTFDPKDKSFEQYLDEYYQLDYEDIIDDLPCRFKYRQVIPNSFGLTTEEILGADEKELNRWCSLKKTCMFRSEREERGDLKTYQIKAKDIRKKQQILKSLGMEDEEALNVQQEGKVKVGKKRRERLKKQQEGDEEDEDTEPTAKMEPVSSMGLQKEEDEEEGTSFLQPKKKMKTEPSEAHLVSPTKQLKKRRAGGSKRLLPGSMLLKVGGREFSGQRLQAYGLNPKRLCFRQLHRQKRRKKQQQQKRQ